MRTGRRSGPPGRRRRIDGAMKNDNMNDTLKKLIPVFLLIAGITVFGVGITNLSRTARYEKTTARITEIAAEPYSVWNSKRTAVNVYVTFEADGREVTAELGSYKKSYTEGSELTVLYDPDNPADATVNNKTAGAVMTGLGAAMLAVDAVLLIPLLRDVLAGNKKKKEEQT